MVVVYIYIYIYIYIYSALLCNCSSCSTDERFRVMFLVLFDVRSVDFSVSEFSLALNMAGCLCSRLEKLGNFPLSIWTK